MPRTTEEWVEKGLSHQRESKYVEFKSEFDESKKAWCDLVKEIVALANTKGGVLIIGLDDDGTPSGFDVEPLLDLDPAEFTDKIRQYTGYQFGEFELRECQKQGHNLLAVVVAPARVPLVFEKPGTYGLPGGEQGRAFDEGKIYFRHGAKSEPGDSSDLREAFDRLLEEERSRWRDGVRKVIEAEPGSQFATLPPGVEGITAADIRVTTDPDAPVSGLFDPDQTHPYRFTDVLERLNERLPHDIEINQHDLIALRSVHDLLEDDNFVYSPKYGSHQYSEALIDWIMNQYKDNPEIFEEARDEYRKMRQQN